MITDYARSALRGYFFGQEFNSPHLHHIGMDFAPFRFFISEKSSYASSFLLFAKGHIRVGYSVASALITPLAHYQPFARKAPTAQISFCESACGTSILIVRYCRYRNGGCFIPIFLCRKTGLIRCGRMHTAAPTKSNDT